MSKTKKTTEYAVVDIETTGGNARGSRMTEVAIRIHDGRNVIKRFETLINPEKTIPLPIFALTGIDNDMVKDAPRFADVAETVHALLDGRVFVAHNVNFDYSFIRHQLEECGYSWNPRKLCTVRMARRIRPGLASYSLGKLCDTLGIPISNRHRAGGDADATAILFGKLLEWDTEAVVTGMLKKTAPDQRLPPNLRAGDFEKLPQVPGVYYFHDRAGKVIYVGKALNLKKRVATHFTGHSINPQRQHFLREIHSITYEICATELMALLRECIEIKRLWPPFNRALKRFEPKFGLFLYEGTDGYLRLAVGRLNKHQTSLQVFDREYDGLKLLRDLVERFGLDTPALTDRKTHNDQVEAAIAYLESSRPTLAIWDKGRTEDEKSCIWIEKGNFYGMGYVANDTDLRSPTDIRDSLTRYRGNHYMLQLVLAYARKYPGRVLTINDAIIDG